MPPGLSHRDHDSQWRDRKSDRRAEGAITSAQFNPSSSGGEVVTWIMKLRASVTGMPHIGATACKHTASHRPCTHRN